MRGAVLVAGVFVVMATGVRSTSQAKPGVDCEELRQLVAEDQADRKAKVIDWAAVLPRDRARLARVKELYAEETIRTPEDYYRAALVLQHSEAADDFLLAHEFCVAAMMLGKNDLESSTLAAAAEDRFLMNIGRAQRFGTQYRSGGAGQPMRLYRTDVGVKDALRKVMAVPSLSEAKAREAEFNAK